MECLKIWGCTLHILIQGLLKKQVITFCLSKSAPSPLICVYWMTHLFAIKWVHWSNSWDLYNLHLCGWQFLFVKLLGNNCYFCKQKLWQYIIYCRKKSLWILVKLSLLPFLHFGLKWQSLGPKISQWFFFLGILLIPWWTILLKWYINKTFSFIAFSILYVLQRILFS